MKAPPSGALVASSMEERPVLLRAERVRPKSRPSRSPAPRSSEPSTESSGSHDARVSAVIASVGEAGPTSRKDARVASPRVRFRKDAVDSSGTST